MESIDPPPEPTLEEAVDALVKYKFTVSNLIASLNESISNEGIAKVSENLQQFMTVFGALEQLCLSFCCRSVGQLEKKLEALVSEDTQEVIQSYFKTYTEWHQFLECCDKLLEKDSNERQESRETFQAKLMDYKLQSLESSLDDVKLRDILSSEPRTWLLFLRHYS